MKFKAFIKMFKEEVGFSGFFWYGVIGSCVAMYSYLSSLTNNLFILVIIALVWLFGLSMGQLIYKILNYKSYIKNRQPTWAKAKYSTIEPLIRLYPNRYELFTNKNYGNYGLEYNDYDRSIYCSYSHYFYMTSLWEYYKVKVLLTEINKELKHIEDEKAESKNTETLYKLWQKDIDKALIQSNEELEQAKQITEQIVAKDSLYHCKDCRYWSKASNYCVYVNRLKHPNDTCAHAQIFSNIICVQTSAPKVKVNPAEICDLKTDNIRR